MRMAFARTSALRSLQQTLRHAGPRPAANAARPANRTQLLARRWASSGGGHAPPGSDMPWLIGGVAVTVPSCYLLWPSASHAEHAHGHEEHAEEAEPAGEEESKGEDAAPPEEETKDDAPPSKNDGGDAQTPSEDEKKDDAPPAEDKKEEDSSESKSGEEEKQGSDDKQEQSSEGGDEQQEDQSEGGDQQDSGDEPKKNPRKGPYRGGPAPETSKSEPEPKGGSKKRIDSGLRKELGGQSAADPSGHSPSSGTQEGKQMGLSSTSTRHSTQIDQDPEKSKKSDGSPETAKATGTVKLDAPPKA